MGVLAGSTERLERERQQERHGGSLHGFIDRLAGNWGFLRLLIEDRAKHFLESAERVSALKIEELWACLKDHLTPRREMFYQMVLGRVSLLRVLNQNADLRNQLAEAEKTVAAQKAALAESGAIEQARRAEAQSYLQRHLGTPGRKGMNVGPYVRSLLGPDRADRRQTDRQKPD